MTMQEPTRPTTCNRCGTPFNTSDQHPRRFCSISCEEGRGPLPDSDPESPNYPYFLQGEPQALVGRNLLAAGLRRTCYSPEWHRDPASYNRNLIVEHDPVNEILVLRDDVFLGRVFKYDEGRYFVEWDDPEYRTVLTRKFDESLVLHQLRRENWWVE